MNHTTLKVLFFTCIILLIGEIKCIRKAIDCTGKAEIVYTVSACTGLGGIVGYIDIKDK